MFSVQCQFKVSVYTSISAIRHNIKTFTQYFIFPVPIALNIESQAIIIIERENVHNTNIK